MPYLRFTRDTRGFENTYLMHAFRIHGRPQPRVLYWFRTPPGVRVGRSPLDEDAIRTIEESNPELKFDWKRILQARPEPAPVDPRRGGDGPRRRQRSRNADRRGAPRMPRRADTRPAPPPRASEPTEPAVGPVEVSAVEEVVEEQVLKSAAPDVKELAPPRADQGRPLRIEDQDRLLRIEGDETDPGEDEELEPEMLPARSARTLDSESHARLRARYAEILARISERTSDPARQEELRRKADRLDPDAWVTADEVRAGLEHYEQIYAELRRGLGRRRRRRGRRGAGRAPEGSGEAGGSSGSGGAEPTN